MSITLSGDEIEAITGYKRPADQLPELRRQGFHRARRSTTTGEIILERAHYDAICAVGTQMGKGPQVRNPFTPKLRAV